MKLKRLFAMNAIQWAAILVLAALLALPSAEAPAAEVNDNIYNYLQLLRSDFNSAKVEIINRIMKLSAEDAKKFWPTYREYENELAKQAINRAEFIAEFVQAHQDGSFNNAKAKDMAKRWFKLQRVRLDLLEEYHGKIEKALSPVQAGQFLQIENQLFIFIDMTIAAEMPLVGQKIK
jgi:DNA repair ATPase RecN